MAGKNFLVTGADGFIGSHLVEALMEEGFVTNCDILVDEDYSKIYKYHVENKNELTIVGALKNFSIPYGTLEVESGGLLKNLKEKPDVNYIINCGMYLLEPHLIDVGDWKEFNRAEEILKRGCNSVKII